MRRKLLLVLFTVIVVSSSMFLPSCGTPASTQPTQTNTTQPAGNPGQTVTVIIENSAFNPQTLTVPVGTTVTWINKEDESHMLTDQAAAFASNLLKKGDTFSCTFTKPGVHKYHCRVNATITGVITVE